MGRKAEAYKGLVHMLFEERITAQELLQRARLIRAEQMRLSLAHCLDDGQGGHASGGTPGRPQTGLAPPGGF